MHPFSEHQHCFQSPLIIIGMHRSGTSMLTDLIGRAGVFIGADASSNSHSESQCFLRLNEALLHMAHANWDYPEPMQWSLEDPTVQSAMAQWLKEQILAGDIDEYDGTTSDIGQEKTIFTQSWGWKDPRNSITLPLWLRLFPNAKVLNIVRNGIAVSKSLVTRELQRKSRLDSPFRSARCLRLDRAFSLWEEYVQAASIHSSYLKQQQMMTISYEDFLISPTTQLASILKFAGVPTVADDLIFELCNDIDASRATAFFDDPELIVFNQLQSQNPTMIQYGYDTAARSIAS